ncbi:MAG: hypothetical protein JKX72_09545 [Robiginitomaculum sp.]|nr:hypothetical protein [Robiginitomaculum sp.]
MPNRFRQALASLAILLGIGHFAFGIIAYKAFSVDLLWFLGFGIAMIVTAFANFKDEKIWILRVQNALVLGSIAALAYLIPQPQILVGLVLFASLFAVSCILPRPNE